MRKKQAVLPAFATPHDAMDQSHRLADGRMQENRARTAEHDEFLAEHGADVANALVVLSGLSDAELAGLAALNEEPWP